MLRLGDWVQSLVKQVEDIPGIGRHVHTLPRGVGHVVDIDEDGDPTVFFERSGTATMVSPDSVVLLCHADGSRADTTDSRSDPRSPISPVTRKPHART